MLAQRFSILFKIHCWPEEIPKTSEIPSNSTVDQPSSCLWLCTAFGSQGWAVLVIGQLTAGWASKSREIKEEDIRDSEPQSPLDLNLNLLFLFSPKDYPCLCEHESNSEKRLVSQQLCLHRLVGSLVTLSLPVWMSSLCWFGFIWACPGKCNACTAVCSHTYRLAYMWQLVVRCLQFCENLSPEDRWEIMTRIVDGDIFYNCV